MIGIFAVFFGQSIEIRILFRQFNNARSWVDRWEFGACFVDFVIRKHSIVDWPIIERRSVMDRVIIELILNFFILKTTVNILPDRSTAWAAYSDPFSLVTLQL